MADVSLIRFVDEQRAQVRYLLDLIAQGEACKSMFEIKSPLEIKSFYAAAVRASQLAVTGYFAELTQPRFNADIWSKLLSVNGNFSNLLRIANVDPSTSPSLAAWLVWQQDNVSPLAVLQAAAQNMNSPQPAKFRSGLLSETSLSEATSSNSRSMIATSASVANQTVTLTDFRAAWETVETQIHLEREQSLEC